MGAVAYPRLLRMRPIVTPATSATFKDLDGRGMPDLPAERRTIDGYPATVSTWEPTPEERIAIAEGANIEVALLTPTPHPPVSVAVSSELRDVTPPAWVLTT